MDLNREIEELSFAVIGAAIRIHRMTGPGLLESAYEELLAYELRRMGLDVIRQLSIPISYQDLIIPDCYRLDIMVNDSIIIETKSVRALEDVHYKQLLTYLRLMKKELGLLINFNEVILKNGIKRVINQKSSRP